MNRFPSKQSRFSILSRGRTKQRGKMNKTETEYSVLLSENPDVHSWWFEPFTVRISHPDKGQPATLTPDFLILMMDGTTYVDDVKGTGLDDNAAVVRMKAAAEQYPLWTWRFAKKRTKKNGGGFAIREI